MKSLSGQHVQGLFRSLGWPFEFSAEELGRYDTIDVVNGESIPADAIAFPVPERNEGLNVLNLRRLSGTDPYRPPSFFDHPWYLEEPFGSINCSPGWHVLSPDVLPGSVGQTADYLSSTNGISGVRPSAIEVVLMLFLEFAATGTQLLGKKHTWCSDITTLNRVVTVGAFGRNGLFISSHPGNYYSRGLGVCPKWS